MNPVRGIVEGFREIGAHKFRSILTTSGIVLGVASLMSMFAVIEGMTLGLRHALQAFGGVEKVTIDAVDPPPWQESMKDLSPGRTYEDVLALRRHATLLAAVSAEKRLNRNVFIFRGNRSFAVHGLRGVEASYLQMESVHRVAHGRFITELDHAGRHRVLVLGSQAAESLFGSGVANAPGSQVSLENLGFTIAGVLEPSEFRWLNDRVFMPLGTMQELFYSSRMANGVEQGPDRKLDTIEVRVRDADKFNAAIDQMRTILARTHRGVQDFGFRTREDWFDVIEGQVSGARLSGGMVAVVCLLAGGVGITNIMLASIRERTREIGVRRAIGAGPADVFGQVVIEVVLLALIGGALGVAAGFGLVELVSRVTAEDRQPVLRAVHVFWSFGAGVTVGVVAGLIPAWKAATLSPVEALRYE